MHGISKLKILLVEDEQTQADYIKIILHERRDIDFFIIHVDTLSSAVEAVKTNEIDLILLDLGLPDGRGYDTFARMSGCSQDVPIVVMTGTDDDDLAARCVRNGAQDYLVKGHFRQDTLVRSILYAIERKKVSEELRRARDELEDRVKERTKELEQLNAALHVEIDQRRQAEQIAQNQARRAEALVRISGRLNAKLNLTDVVDAICHETAEMLDVPTVITRVYDPDAGNVLLSRVYGLGDGRPISEEVLSAIDSLVNFDAYLAIHSGDERMPEVGFRTLIIAPMIERDRLAGSITLCCSSVRELTEDEASLLTGLSNQAALAVTNAWLFDQVQRGRERLQNLSRRLVAVQENEKRHLSRELHDQVGQMLTGVKLIIDMVRRGMSKSVENDLNEAVEILDELMKQVREMSLELRPSMLDDLGLLHTLHWHLNRYELQTGIRVKFTHMGLKRRFPPEIEIAAYRVIQEALTNIAKYAQVKEAFLNVIAKSDVLTIKVKDEGIGFNPDELIMSPSTDGLSCGLSGMRERVVLLGGKFKIRSRLGEGSVILAKLPLKDHLERRGRSGIHSIGR